ncbi:hypothetical protein THRCLA_08819 [Thraustotheca clavata]|uniref:Aspartyl/asparaginy/proline hydroxylase domain-containing protein n=1 Tax=Thraustotheca clavata TaxID=74557 RepID=A0A1V9Z226_9STRA|nr:hypothetical protein THRCLA_08819 [Thraustotheca clavata]
MPLDYDVFYSSDAVSNGLIPFCNIGMHPLDIAAKVIEVPQAYQSQLYRSAMQLPIVNDALRSLERIQVLDVGCGTGAGLHVIHKTLENFCRGHLSIVGIDKCQIAIKHSKKFHSKHKVLHYDVEKRMSAFSRDKFDLVVGIQSLQECSAASLDELQRIMKPHALLVMADFVCPQQTFDFLNIISTHPNFKLVFQKDASYHATLAAKAGSPGLRNVLNECVNDKQLQKIMADMLILKKTKIYEDLRLGNIQFGFFCFEYVPTTTTDEDKNVENEHERWESDQSCSDDDDDDIDDSANPSYYDYKEIYPQLELLRSNYTTIQKEALKAQLSHDWPNWPEDHYIGEDGEWRVFPLCYTFPAWDASKTTWVSGTCVQCPNTVALLKQIPGIRTALFSKLGPQTTLGAHRGWADLANDILRCHVGLDVPQFDANIPEATDEEASCCIVVSGESRAQANGRVFVFDDSKIHYAFNHHPSKSRCILILDLYRPDHLPRGMARGGHTDELDDFIEQYNAAMNC